MFKESINLKEKLKKRQITIGTWITLGNSSIAEILSNCSFDWLVIDMEHSIIGLSKLQEMIRAISLYNKVPLVRISDHNSTLIKRVMDAGASGILVPNIKTADEAKNVIKAVKYPPLGTRGVGLARAQKYGFDFENYKNWINKGSIVIAQIEHFIGIKNLTEILLLDELDGVIIGPYDLSGSVGIPGKFDEPIMKEMIDEFLKKTIDMNVTAGYHIIQPDLDEVKLRINQGFNFIGYSLDEIVIGKKFRDDLQQIKEIIKG